MGNNGASDSISALYEYLASQPSFNQSGFAVFRQFYNEACVAVRRASLSSGGNYILSLYRKESGDRGKAVFLTTFIIAMAGCGLLTSLLRRRWPSDQTRPVRPTARKTSSKSSTRTLTSSDDDYEDEEDVSHKSMRHKTDSQRQAAEWSAQPQHQSSNGKRGHSLTSMVCS